MCLFVDVFLLIMKWKIHKMLLETLWAGKIAHRCNLQAELKNIPFNDKQVDISHKDQVKMENSMIGL